jgi:hypothetical protein
VLGAGFGFGFGVGVGVGVGGVFVFAVRIPGRLARASGRAGEERTFRLGAWRCYWYWWLK